jgi:hypothetical protein
MFRFHAGPARCAAALGAALLAAMPAYADIQNYEFRITDNTLTKGDAIIEVQLVNKTTGVLVPGAIIFAKRLDMAPDGMAEMDTKIEELPGSQPGMHRFAAYLSMTGQWQLSLAAKVQGETGTLENKLLIKADK